MGRYSAIGWLEKGTVAGRRTSIFLRKAGKVPAFGTRDPTRRRLPPRRFVTPNWLPGALARTRVSARNSQDQGSTTTFQGPSAWMKKTAASLPSTFAVCDTCLVSAKYAPGPSKWLLPSTVSVTEPATTVP